MKEAPGGAIAISRYRGIAAGQATATDPYCCGVQETGDETLRRGGAMPEPWRETSQERVFSSHWVSVSRRSYRLPNGSDIDDFYVVEEPPGVTVVALTPRNDVV